MKSIKKFALITIITIFVAFPALSNAKSFSSSEIISLTNNERTNLELTGLQENAKLNQAAMLKAQDMFSNQYFAHTSPTGTNSWYWFDKVNYNYQYAGENLAIGFTDSYDAVSAWMASPTHKANIVNENYNEIGVAVLGGTFEDHYTYIIVQEFGTQFDIQKQALVSKKQKTIAYQEKTDTENESVLGQNESKNYENKVKINPIFAIFSIFNYFWFL